jgi:integrase
VTTESVVTRYANRGGPTEALPRVEDPLRRLKEYDETGDWPAARLTMDKALEAARRVVVGLEKDYERRSGLAVLLRSLSEAAGHTWQERWLAAGHEDDPHLWKRLGARPSEASYGMHLALTMDLIRPSYAWCKGNQFKTWRLILELRDPASYQRLHNTYAALGAPALDDQATTVVLAHIACRTGKSVAEMTGYDILHYQAALQEMREQGTKVKVSGQHHAWDCLREMGHLQHPSDTLRLALTRGQLSPAELVARHGFRPGPVPELLVRYLAAREGALDYSSLRTLSDSLCRLFWKDIEQHAPEATTLALSTRVASEWKARLATKPDGSERRSRFNTLIHVRAMYLDIAQWAHSEPEVWAPHVAASPVTEADVAGYGKQQKENKARSHQRTRERAPELPRLLRAVDERLKLTEGWLAEAKVLPVGAIVEHNGVMCRRIGAKHVVLRPVTAPDRPGAGDIDLTTAEDEAFWAWATVHLLHQTGLRIEELLELDQFSIQSWRNPQSGETVPLLHVYPSKSGSERLLAASPELVHVLARIITRLRQPDGTLPLTSRYDTQEHTEQKPAPLLFQRKRARYAAMSYQYIYYVLDRAGEWAGLRKANGKPLTIRPHDLRRIFATDAQSSGVPIHVIAAILGHDSVETTAIYAAVYPKEVINAHRQFIAHRRATRPGADQREITEEEWEAFQRHFVQRKLSLGTCGRAWGSDCEHEHACVRCSLLRPDPAELDRWYEIRDNLRERIAEAHQRGWLGEVEGLQISLDAAIEKIEQMERMRMPQQDATGATFLGLPALPPRSST